MSGEALLSVREVTRTHGRGGTAVHALRGVSLDVRAGELVAVMGPSGSGKSTLLTLAGGLDTPTAGEVRLDGVRTRTARREALAALAEVEVEDLADRLPDELSGGQQQRIAIARALVGPRQVVLADEPTGALDSVTGEQIMMVLRRRVDAGAAGLLVTHDARHAAWADRVVFLRDGVVVDASGPLEGPESLLGHHRAGV